MHQRYLLAIPVFNEQDHLSDVLCESRRYIDDILVIDDGSTDATPEILDVQPVIAVVRHDFNLGYGASLISAFRHAIAHGYDWLITMDCDRQHEPSFIPRFMEIAEENRHDMISGSRYTGQFDEADTPPPDRRRINERITRMLNCQLDLNITDAFCGFKTYRVEALHRLNITVEGYAMPMQLWVQAHRAGLRVTEIPVRLIYNDPTRHFGGELDDPASRYEHYLVVFNTEMTAGPSREIRNSRCRVASA